MPTAVEPLGDRGYLARFETEDRATRWADALRLKGWPGVLDVVPAFRTVGVFADPTRIDLDDLAGRLERLTPAEEGPGVSGRLVRVPVLYDGDDLADVARRTGLSEEGVIAAHSGTEYRVYALGFQPGFAYAGDLAASLHGLPRRGSPRTRVPAGAVAVVGKQTAIYPSASPGGWHLVGRTPLKIVDLALGRFPIRAGDRLRFEPIGRDAFEALLGEPL